MPFAHILPLLRHLPANVSQLANPQLVRLAVAFIPLFDVTRVGVTVYLLILHHIPYTAPQVRATLTGNFIPFHISANNDVQSE